MRRTFRFGTTNSLKKYLVCYVSEYHHIPWHCHGIFFLEFLVQNENKFHNREKEVTRMICSCQFGNENASTEKSMPNFF